MLVAAARRAAPTLFVSAVSLAVGMRVASTRTRSRREAGQGEDGANPLVLKVGFRHSGKYTRDAFEKELQESEGKGRIFAMCGAPLYLSMEEWRAVERGNREKLAAMDVYEAKRKVFVDKFTGQWMAVRTPEACPPNEPQVVVAPSEEQLLRVVEDLDWEERSMFYSCIGREEFPCDIFRRVRQVADAEEARSLQQFLDEFGKYLGGPLDGNSHGSNADGSKSGAKYWRCVSGGGTMYDEVGIAIGGGQPEFVTAVVDTGASGQLVPQKVCDAFYRKNPFARRQTRSDTLADGSKAKSQVAPLEFHYRGDVWERWASCARDPRAEPLLGMSILEEYEIRVDTEQESPLTTRRRTSAP